MWAERRIYVKPGGTYNDHWAVSIKLTPILLNKFFVSRLLPHVVALYFHLTANFHFVVARGYVQSDTFIRLVRPRHWFLQILRRIGFSPDLETSQIMTSL